jgi:hypothetical protein
MDDYSRFQTFMNSIIKHKEYLVLNNLKELHYEWYERGILSLYYVYRHLDQVDVNHPEFDAFSSKLIKQILSKSEK